MSELFSVYHSSPAVAVIWDPLKPWHILQISDNVSRLGYTETVLKEREDGLAGLIHPDDYKQATREISRYIRERKPNFSNFYRISTSEHGFRWVEDKTHIQYEKDETPTSITSVIWISSSILALIQEKEGAKAWNSLNSRIRHDILNQLTAILGYLEISTDYIQQPEILDFIRKEYSAAEKIKEKLIFTREYQQIGLEIPYWHNLRDLISESFEETRIASLSLNCDIPPVWLFCDETIKKALIKIFENIPVHSNGADSVSVSFSRTPSGDGKLIIEDNGCGIAEDVKKRIFDLGYGSGGGKGLYLALSLLSIPHFSISETGSPQSSARFEILIPSENISRIDETLESKKEPSRIP
ncbi:MAG: PAS domain-containing protein [Methanospirillaceae archaeon]|nr:PAS domain-containing protein [Methanospirillaceae archaeon]